MGSDCPSVEAGRRHGRRQGRGSSSGKGLGDKTVSCAMDDTLSQNKKLNIAVRTSTSKGGPDAVNLVDLSKGGLTFTLDNF